jgi:hypothetical protein
VLQTKVLKKMKPRISCSTVFFPENRAICEIMWKNMVKPERPHMKNNTAQKNVTFMPKKIRQEYKHTLKNI